jgi:two-component system, sensor histidine kinase
MNSEAKTTLSEILPNFDQQVVERRLDMLLKQTTMTGLFSVLFASILTLTMQNSVHFSAMLYWLGTNVAMVTIREGIIYPKIRQKRTQGRLKAQFVLSTITGFWLFSGLLWGWAGYFYLPGSDQIELMIAFIAVMVGITSGNIISFAPAVWIGLLFVTPTILGFALRIQQYNYSILFYCMLFYLLYLFITMFRVSKVVIHTISLDLKNQHLLQQVTEEKQRAEEERIKAEHANQSKTEFMTSASHDLRQPLNSLGLFIFALKQKIQSGAGDSLQVLDKVEQAHKSVSGMFSRMLEVSSVETGKIIPQPAQIETRPIVSAIVDEYHQQCLNKRIQINYQAVQANLYTDELLFTRIVRNLVDNAVKYTQQGEIVISEVLTDQSYRLNIMDTGIGIPAIELPRIFDEYHQVGNKRRDARQGLGLGLFITFRLCQLLGFKIEVSSVEGQGSCFSVIIPLRQADLLPEEHSPAEILPPFPHLRVLVVDDDPDILSGMTLILQQWQCIVDTASDADSAIQLASQTAPDIILCDYRLDETITGLEVLKHLEAILNKAVPAIFITGEHLASSLTENELFRHRVLQKPIVPSELHSAIQQQLFTASKA